MLAHLNWCRKYHQSHKTLTTFTRCLFLTYRLHSSSGRTMACSWSLKIRKGFIQRSSQDSSNTNITQCFIVGWGHTAFGFYQTISLRVWVTQTQLLLLRRQHENIGYFITSFFSEIIQSFFPWYIYQRNDTVGEHQCVQRLRRWRISAPKCAGCKVKSRSSQEIWRQSKHFY